MKNVDWFYLDSSQSTLGPFSADQIKQLIREGVIKQESFIWAEPLEDFALASTVAEFSSQFSLYNIVEAHPEHARCDEEATECAATIQGNIPKPESKFDAVVADWLSEQPSTPMKGNRPRSIPSPASSIPITGRCLSCNKVFTSSSQKRLCWDCESNMRMSTAAACARTRDGARPERILLPADAIAEGENEEKKKCPMCAELVQKTARICRFCSYDFVHHKSPNMAIIQPITGKEQFLFFMQWIFFVCISCIIFLLFAVASKTGRNLALPGLFAIGGNILIAIILLRSQMRSRAKRIQSQQDIAEQKFIQDRQS